MMTSVVRSGVRVEKRQRSRTPVIPSVMDDLGHDPFSLDQELVPFGTWTTSPIWVPPKDCSKDLAKSMLLDHGWLASKDACWSSLISKHRSKFTQVREIEMSQASIRLPKTKLFVTVTEKEHFNSITDTIPSCVQTRLDEFMNGPGKQRGVKVYYIKPLCVEVGDDLIFTTTEELNDAILSIQGEVFSEYRRLYMGHRGTRLAMNLIDTAFAIPKKILSIPMKQRKQAIEAYHAKLEFNRRKAALRAVNIRRKYRTDECTFDDILSITNTPDRSDVIDQYALERKLSHAEKRRLMLLSAAVLPWFATLSLSAYYLASVAIAVSSIAPVLACDPAFVAEMPDSNGVVLKIGHFDEVRGVMHVEI